MLRLRYINKINNMQYQAELLIPLAGILTGIIIPVAAFIWLYFDTKGKRETVLEISKNLDDSSKVEELLKIFEERKKEPGDGTFISKIIVIYIFFKNYIFLNTPILSRT